MILLPLRHSSVFSLRPPGDLPSGDSSF